MDESKPSSQKPEADALPVLPESPARTPPVQPQPAETTSPVTEKQPEATPPQAPSKRKRILLVAVGLLLLALLVGGGYFLIKNGFFAGQKACTQEAKVCPDGTSVGRTGPNCEFAPCPTETPDETANWKTYTNREYRYSVKYPSGWEVREAKPPDTPNWTYDILQENQLHKVKLLEGKIGTWPGSFVISISKNPENFDTESWGSNYFVPLITDPTTNLAEPKGKISIDNNTAYKFSVFQFDSYRTEIGLVKNGNIYMFSFVDDTPNDPDLEKHKEIYGQILSAFKFSD